MLDQCWFGIAPLRGVAGLLAEAHAVGEPRGVREPIDGPMAMEQCHVFVTLLTW